jgi:hypothetical protein
MYSIVAGEHLEVEAPWFEKRGVSNRRPRYSMSPQMSKKGLNKYHALNIALLKGSDSPMQNQLRPDFY